MPWDIAACGTLHRDDITTPHGHSNRLGGSAVYFALAASLYARVLLQGITGADTAGTYRRMLHGTRADMRGVVVSETPTFIWHAVHDFERWVTATESSEPGCDPEWVPCLDDVSRAAPVLFLGSMHPALQHRILAQSSARLIGADSMTVFMRDDIAAVREVVRSADILFLNGEEVQLLAGVEGWRPAARRLIGDGRLRAVVVKQGPDGASCLTVDGEFERAAHPVERVVDPTGAGDALAGGFLGLCARDERDDLASFPAALGEGVRCASAAVSAFGADGLLQMLREEGGVSAPPV